METGAENATLAHTYEPTEIKLYREFPVKEKEITVAFKNETAAPLYVYTRVVIRDRDLIPVAEGELKKRMAPKAPVFSRLSPAKRSALIC